MISSAETNLIALIEEAFSGVRLEDGTSLNMTEYHDSGGLAPEYAEKVKFDERDDWHKIDDKTLEKFTVTFSFTDLKGFRFYIPAYMIWTIRNHRTSDCIIGDFTIYALNTDHYLFEDVPFTTWFTTQQVSAMVAFLKYCTEQSDSCDVRVATENLAKMDACLKAGPKH